MDPDPRVQHRGSLPLVERDPALPKALLGLLHEVRDHPRVGPRRLVTVGLERDLAGPLLAGVAVVLHDGRLATVDDQGVSDDKARCV